MLQPHNAGKLLGWLLEKSQECAEQWNSRWLKHWVGQSTLQLIYYCLFQSQSLKARPASVWRHSLLLKIAPTVSLYMIQVKFWKLLLFPKGEQIVAALSVRPSVCPSHFYLEHISKRFEGNFMRLDTLIEDQEEKCTMQESYPCH